MFAASTGRGLNRLSILGGFWAVGQAERQINRMCSQNMSVYVAHIHSFLFLLEVKRHLVQIGIFLDPISKLSLGTVG